LVVWQNPDGESFGAVPLPFENGADLTVIRRVLRSSQLPNALTLTVGEAFQKALRK
jgi:hypothetical protein